MKKAATAGEAKKNANVSTTIKAHGLIEALLADSDVRRDREGERSVLARFGVLMSKEQAALLPESVRRSWKEMEQTFMQRADLDSEQIAEQTVEVHLWPESKADPADNSSIKVVGAKLTKISLRVVKSKTDRAIWCYFSVGVPLANGGHWLVDNHGNQVWLKMGEAQGVLA
jgi:hypothetical protein